jgi:DNA-binding response OmpR family regulator
MSKEKILVVDDDEDILELLKFTLSREGYFVPQGRKR